MDEVLVLILLAGAVQVELLDPLDRQFLMSQRDFVGIRSKLPGISVHMGWESRGEEHNLDVLRQ